MSISNKARILAVAGLSALALSWAAGAALPAAEEALPAHSSVPPAHKYILREYMGMVAVYTADEQMVRLTDYPVSALPEADRLSLARGMMLYDDDQLAMLLEDYQS